MRLVIDMQGAQTGSRFRGIGRYSMSLAKGIARNRGNHEVLLALSGLFPETHDSIRAEFAGLLPPENIRVWHAIGPTRETDPANRLRREVSERIREAFLASLQPDVVLITSLFEGLGDDAIGSIGILNDRIPTAVILYDLIPLLNPDEHFRTSEIHANWYRRKIAWLKRSRMLLAISESSRQEALSTGYFAAETVVNVSGACDDSFRVLKLSETDRRAVWKKLGISRAFVMYTGGADERKNLHRLIESYAQMPTAVRRGHQLVLAGKMPNGNVESYLKTADRCGLSRNEIVVTGYIDDDDLIKLYNCCALFVFPSLHEGFGLPPLEAMACGAPVIAANSTSLPEVIGLPEAMFDPHSMVEITAKMTVALTNDEFRARLVAHGRSHYRTFSWDRSAKTALDSILDLQKGASFRTSSLLNVEKTSLFEKRRLRILAIKLDHMGDFILAIPALSKLRARYPYASIDIIVGGWNVPIAQELKLFDNVHAYNFFKRKSSEDPSAAAEVLTALLDELGRYDIAIDLRRPADTRFVLVKAKADVRIGYQTFDKSIDDILDVAIRSYPDVPFRTTPLNETSIAVQMLRVVDAIPDNVNDFVTFPSIGNLEEREQGTVAIFPKAGTSAREWDKSNVDALVALLDGDPLVKGINIYFANDQEASEFAFAPHRHLQVHVGLAFPALTQSLSRNSVCVANNSGGGHLASYLGLTVIGIYSGHELPAEWAPQFFDSNVIHRAAQCSPCHGAQKSDCPNGFFCLSDISVNDVYGRVVEAIFTSSWRHEGQKAHFRRDIPFQRNTDSIVRGLTSSIAQLGVGDGRSLLDISVVLAKNHPTFSLTPDLGSIYPDVPVDHKSGLVDWRGFSGAEPEFRWTDGNRAAMLFDCPEGTPARGRLILLIDTIGRQRIIARLNALQVIDTVESGSHIALRMQVANLESGRNSLEFELPDAKVPSNGDGRRLAIAVRRLQIQVEDDDSIARSCAG
jgi:glycosyltransferase involved in cell wall biosynthesis/ADP-heptose:LPS heptosyltransferase